MSQMMTPSEGLKAANGLLDKIAETQGRVKCGYIWSLTTLLEDIQKVVADMENELKKTQPEPEISVEVLQNGTENGNEEAQ